jgi:hypothetical protein
MKCNRRLTHELSGESQPRVRGKLDLFPLADESQRARAPGEENREQPLLLNPCIDDPAEHLIFATDKARMGMMLPREHPQRGPSRKGSESIGIYVLNRVPLVAERHAMMLRIKQQLQRVDRLLRKLNAAETEDDHTSLREEWQEEYEILLQFRHEREEYQLLAAQLIEPYIASLKAEIEPRVNPPPPPHAPKA